jgi:outer membrane protein, multidrug efflux system
LFKQPEPVEYKSVNEQDMLKYIKSIAPIFMVLLLMASCNPFRPGERPAPQGALPQLYSLYTGQADPAQRWWHTYEAPELDRLVNEALSDSFSLKEAWARLRQTEAVARITGADLYPDLTGTAGALYARQKSDREPGGADSFEDYSLGLVSSYEVDLWGRIRSEREAALLQVNATREDLHAAAITLSAEVTNRWIRIVSQRLQIDLLGKQLQNNLIFQELIELRFRKAMVSALDVYQQKQVVENVKAEIPLAEAEEQLLMHELAVLLGKPPGTRLGISRDVLPEPTALPTTGLPADLLANRPDIRSSGSRLKAADWQVAAARANRLPSITLTARAIYGQGDLDVLFDNWLLSLAGNLTAPILDGGRRAAEVDRRIAIADENLWNYRKTVLTAIKEVEDALVSETKQRAHIEALEQVHDAARRGLEEAVERYRNGLSDYLPVLTQLLTTQNLERNLIRQRTLLLLDRVSLHRALGGSWVTDLEPDGLL